MTAWYAGQEGTGLVWLQYWSIQPDQGIELQAAWHWPSDSRDV